MANIETSMSFTSTTQGGDKLQKAITDINPNATSDKLVGFAQRLNALTTNDYGGAVKITKQELSTNKTAATIKIGKSGASAATTEITVARNDLVITNDACFFNIYTNSNGKPFVVSNSAAVAVDFAYQCVPSGSSNGSFWVGFMLSLGTVAEWCPNAGEYFTNLNGDKIMEYGGTGAGDLVIALAESDTYTQSNTVTIHITA